MTTVHLRIRTLVSYPPLLFTSTPVNFLASVNARSTSNSTSPRLIPLPALSQTPQRREAHLGFCSPAKIAPSCCETHTSRTPRSVLFCADVFASNTAPFLTLPKLEFGSIEPPKALLGPFQIVKFCDVKRACEHDSPISLFETRKSATAPVASIY